MWHDLAFEDPELFERVAPVEYPVALISAARSNFAKFWHVPMESVDLLSIA